MTERSEMRAGALVDPVRMRRKKVGDINHKHKKMHVGVGLAPGTTTRGFSRRRSYPAG